MSANRLKHSQSGFTLIEVTLAIVIGVVVIAGATVLYNQAKNSATLSAAQTKVNAAAATVEEFSARNFGKYPSTAQFRNAWKRNRAEDYNVSPWGGTIADATNVVDGVYVLNAGYAAAIADVDTVAAAAGAIEYASGSINPAYDAQRQATVPARGYAIWIRDAAGTGPNFVTGGK